MKSSLNRTQGLRALPSVDELVSAEALQRLAEETERALVVAAARTVLGRWREQLRVGQVANPPPLAVLADEVAAEVRELLALSLCPVINATGVVLHTNLGRAPLSAVAVRNVFDIATQYSNLEFDLASGTRGRRDTHTSKFLNRLLAPPAAGLGAEASILVNNNAAAVLLVLNTLAGGPAKGGAGEVVVSRGELIEIGGSFRIPDIMARSGARLVEVGTTNRTRIDDYARAINKNTRLLLRVHRSNFRMVGFVKRPELAELVALARRHRLPLYEDLGSGCLVDLSPQGVKEEPVAAASLAAGVDIITFSGDKLLGGPQAGVIAGRKKLVERCRQNPLFRALRVDKMTYAAMEATLRSYLKGAMEEVPALRMIRLTAAEIGERAARLAESVRGAVGKRVTVEVIAGRSVIGGGSAPGQALPTRLVAIRPAEISTTELAARLRRHEPPVVGRVEAERVLLDLRTVFEEQEPLVVAALRQALQD